jgi:putative PIN family toxin of toxin-antitoxin system
MRIVLDTNILARAARGGTGPAAEVLVQVADPAHVLVLSPFLILELSRVLRYPRVRTMHGLDDAGIDTYVQAVQSMGMIAIPASATPTPIVTNDPKDDAVIATAVDGQAEILCTLDRHFRDPAVLAYCAQHGIRVLSDIELLNEFRASKTP